MAKALSILTILGTFLAVTSCHKSDVAPTVKPVYADLSANIENLVKQDSSFLVFIYNTPATSSAPYVVKALNNDIIVKESSISVRNTNYKFSFDNYKSMNIHYKLYNEGTLRKADQMSIYFYK
ncbi:MAG: hypothetical protein EOO61_11505, partial [Hymenobacter sp.]